MYLDNGDMVSERRFQLGTAELPNERCEALQSRDMGGGCRKNEAEEEKKTSGQVLCCLGVAGHVPYPPGLAQEHVPGSQRGTARAAKGGGEGTSSSHHDPA